MAGGRRSLGELLAMGVIAGLVAFGLAYATRPRGKAKAPPRAPTVLETRGAVFELHPGAAQLTVRSRDGAVSRDLDLSLVLDGTPHPLVLARDDVRPGLDSLRAAVPMPLGDGVVEAQLELRADPARDALTIDVTAPPSPEAAGHTVALRADVASEGQVVFVSGVGQLADRATVTGGALLVDAEPHPIALTTGLGPLGVEAIA